MNLTPWQYWNWTLPAPGPSTDEQYVEVRESAGARPGRVRGAHQSAGRGRVAPARRARARALDGVAPDPQRAIRGNVSEPFPARGKVRLARRRREPVAGGSRRRRAVRVLRQKVAKKYDARRRFPHLAHMAAHTYARVGRFRSAVDASLAATRADDALTRGCVWPYGEAHNRAMLAAAAAAASSGPEGERVAWCAAAADPGTADTPSLFLDQHAGFLTAFHDVPKLLVAARFGRWRSVLRLAAEAERRAVNQALAEFGTASQTQKTFQRKLPPTLTDSPSPRFGPIWFPRRRTAGRSGRTSWGWRRRARSWTPSARTIRFESEPRVWTKATTRGSPRRGGEDLARAMAGARAKSRRVAGDFGFRRAHRRARRVRPRGRRSLPRVQPVQARQEEVGIDRGARVGRRATRARG